MAETDRPFKWTFRRMGGLDQVELRGGEDICRLGELDPKLWVALSCPAKGMEFDQRTLALIDRDRDGRIRIPEVVGAAEWLCARLKDPGVIARPHDALPLDAIDDAGETGRRLAATCRAILASLGKAGEDSLSQEDVTRAAAHASEQMFNGDGILPPLDGLDEDVRAFIRDALAVTGGVEDAGGQAGITAAIADAFVQTLADFRGWLKMIGDADTPLGADTAECWELLTSLKEKIDDYFLRCELIAYAPGAQDALNYEDKALSVDAGVLDRSSLAQLPLSKAGPDRPLDLATGINPAWREKMERFARLTAPFRADAAALSRQDWLKVQDVLAPFALAVAKKPAPPAVPDLTVPPTRSADTLGEERIGRILDGDVHTRFLDLVKRDAAGPAASTDVADAERLVLYYLHLHRLFRNFVNFEAFYDPDESAMFQSGHLYIDGRSCDLCMPADNVEAHSALASGSRMFLLYCACSRGRKAGENAPEKTMNIVAAVTAGDSDLLTVNRNGVFVDSRGRDWDATVVKTVSNPIGLWQAAWSPYKRLGTLITDQISKYASEKQAGIMATAGKKLDEVGSSVAAGTAPKFDIGRNVGLFAAVGLALGAIGTAVGSIANALLAMAWWQIPLLLIGIFLVISGPSVLLAWLKLRQRTLGPLLEASGWAVNGRVALNYAMARRLSATAALPANARRSDIDAAIRARRIRNSAFWTAVAIGALLALATTSLRHVPFFGGKAAPQTEARD